MKLDAGSVAASLVKSARRRATRSAESDVAMDVESSRSCDGSDVRDINSRKDKLGGGGESEAVDERRRSEGDGIVLMLESVVLVANDGGSNMDSI